MPAWSLQTGWRRHRIASSETDSGRPPCPGRTGLYTNFLDTTGFWLPGAKNAYGFLDTRVQDNDYGIERIDLFQRITGSDLPSRTATSCTFFGSGMLLWALLLLAAMKIDSRKPRGLLLTWPALLVVLTILIATPVAFSLRYVFVLAIGLPIYCVETFSHAPLEGKEHAEKRASRRPHRRQRA